MIQPKLSYIKDYHSGVLKSFNKNIDIESYDDLYQIVNNILNQIEVRNKKGIEKLLDHFYFVVLEKDKDNLKQDLKEIIKSENVSNLNLLETIQGLVYYSVNCKVVENEREEWNDETITTDSSIISISTISFSYYLTYVFNLMCKDTLYLGRDTLKPSDFDTQTKLLSIAQREDKTLYQFCMQMTPGAKGVKTTNINKLINVGCEQLIDCKLETYSIYYLMKELLSKDEFIFYNALISAGMNLMFRIRDDMVEDEHMKVLSKRYISNLRKRKYLLPKNGVRVTSGDRELDLFERQYDDSNYLVIMSINVGYNFVTIINIHTGVMYSNSCCTYDDLNIVARFYGLFDDEEGLDKTDPILYKSMNFIDCATHKIHIIKGTSKEFDEYEVTVPYYWRYKGSSSNSTKNYKVNNLEKYQRPEQYISAFKRGLPSGYKRSKEAEGLSKIYCIELKEDETLVSPFVRNKKE